VSGESDARVPGYLGRVLDGEGEPVGTCFQIEPGLLATAWHVLDDIHAGEVGEVVSVDPLAGGAAREATVVAIDPLADLAVLRTEVALPASIGGLSATDSVTMSAAVLVTGVSEVDEPGRSYRYLDAAGEWSGGTTRDDQLRLGRLRSGDIVPGMSGAPVRAQSDDLVVGVVSARYNSADGWLGHSVWVARCERLASLCDGLGTVALADASRPAGAIDLVLEVGERDVRLSGPGIDITAPHLGIRPGLRGAIDDVRRARALAGTTSRAPASRSDIAAGELTLERAGRLLADSFLPEPVATALAEAFSRAELAHQAVRLGVVCPGPFAVLPWEALPEPRGGRPLALLALVDVHRRAAAQPPPPVPGPLRILVAIASPDHGGGAVLDYERELRNVLKAVRAARQDGASVRVVPFATPAAIRAALDAAPAHVLHLSGHASPSSFVFERDDGAALALDADEFVERAIPAGRMPAVVALAACSTNVAAASDRPSFAARLLERGASVVIASETSVTDRYATRVLARIYERLAESSEPDVVAAVCDARRTVQAELDTSPDERDRVLGSMGEWAVLSVLAPEGSVPIFDPSVTAALPPAAQRVTIGAITARAVGDFVGRRGEQRRWPADLLAEQRSGMVMHGIGGVGKTTLAEELVGRLLERDQPPVLATLTGPLTVEGVLGAMRSALSRELLMREQLEGDFAQALAIVARADVPWAERLGILRRHVLGAIPLLVVLDNFEDNLDRQGRGATVRDPILAALLAAWVADPGLSRLLVTCRFAFALPDGAEQRLSFQPLGPLSAAETRKLLWSLPALDRLTDAEADRVWRMVGGHPRALEYLDALLSRGEGRYPDITSRLGRAVTKHVGAEKAEAFLRSERQLDGALAEVATYAADDVLLDDLLGSLRATPGAEELLVGLSVYREPVDVNALLFAVGEPDDTLAYVPDRDGANERIRVALEAAGVDTTGSVDLAGLPAAVLEEVTPHLEELRRQPAPPRRPHEQIAVSVNACIGSSLLALAPGKDGGRFFVHRWSAGEIDRRLAAAARSDELVEAHVRAADFWGWRASVWPQDRSAQVHDLLEVRHHLLSAGRVAEAATTTEIACSTLHDLGSWDEEAALVHDTLARLPETSDRRAAWIGQLGILAQERGDYAAADKHFQQALLIDQRLENQAGVATGYHQLGNLAYLSGDYDEAARRYQRSLKIEERLGNQAGMATSCHQLGRLAYLGDDYDEADKRYQQALQINEQLGNQAGMATGYHQLGILAQLRGDYDEADKRYRQALQIDERLGNRAGVATGYSQLGILSAARDDVDEAVALHGRALAIRSQLGVPDMRVDTHHLREHRAALGEDAFLLALSGGISAESAAAMIAALDDLARRQAAAEEEGSGAGEPG